MSDLEIVMSMLGIVLAVSGWAFIDNKRGHKSIYEKLHADHNNLNRILMDLYEKLGGKREHSFRPMIDGPMLAGALFYAGFIYWQVQANAEDLSKVSDARVVAIEKDVESTREATERIEDQQKEQKETLDKIYDELRKP